jgi:hypothetical protein
VSARALVRPVLLAVALALASTAVKGSVMEYHGWDCHPAGVRECPRPVAARGWPILFVVDKTWTSPTPNVDLLGALVGIDSFRWTRFAGTLAFWLALTLGARALLARRGRP